ncbi:MAG: MFS transporter [Desulfosarcinaceae bacterium]|nr:MFS transporter [Desulfosarcinaceae bacterium]
MKTYIKYRLIICSIILFTSALGINVVLNSSSVDKLCEETILAQYQIVGENLQKTLVKLSDSDDALRDNALMTPILVKANSQLDRIVESGHRSSQDVDFAESIPERYTTISLIRPDIALSASTDKTVLQQVLASQGTEVLRFLTNQDTKASSHFRGEENYLLKFPIFKSQKQILSTVIITIPEEKVQTKANFLLKKNYKALLIIYLGGMILLAIVFFQLRNADLDNKYFSKTRLSLTFFVIICGAQIAFSSLTIYTFTDQYLVMNKEKARMQIGLLKDQLIHYQTDDSDMAILENGETILASLLSETPELNDISIFDNKWHPLYIGNKDEILNCQIATTAQVDNIKRTLPEWDPKFNVRLTLEDNDQIHGYISTNLSKSILYDRLIEIALDSITVLVISILFLVEMMIFIFYVVKERPKRKKLTTIIKEKIRQNMEQAKALDRDRNAPLVPKGSPSSSIIPNTPDVHYGLMRPAAFLLLFGYDISMSFLPLHTEKLYAPIFGLSKDMVMGLPISVELLFVGISILISGIWLDKRGWHEPFIAGLFLAGTGTLYSWGAPDVINFIFSRAITGTGYGLALMASQGFVIEFSDTRSKAQGLAYLFAGIYAGSLCGGATGAMLADRFDYNSVFFAGALILFGVIGYSFIFMRDGMRKPQRYSIPNQVPAAPTKKVFRFLTNRIVIALVFFSSLPAAIAVVGFLNYFSPIYLHRIGASQSTIGRILMIYGICLIYIGPLVSKYVDASNKKRLYVFMGCALGSMAFLTFNVIEGLIAASVSMLLLGLSSSFVLASQSAYTLRLSVTEELGAGKSIGIFRSTSRIGQVLGPIVFSWLILSTNIEAGITYFGLAYFVFAIIFLLLTVNDKEQLAF